MEDKYKMLAALRTDEELRQRIDNREKYLPETVEASVAELQFRGEIFSEEELQVISEDMQARRDMAATPVEGFGLFGNRDQNNLVDDPDAPAFYSRGAIYGFTVFFSVIFGGIMLAMNVAQTSQRRKAVWIVLFALAYTLVALTLAQSFHVGSGFAVLIGIAGAYLMEALFWNRYIGTVTLYRKRAIWPPLIIGLAFVAIFIVLLFLQGGMPVGAPK